MELMGLVPALILLRGVGVIRRLVWDQHELPFDRFLRSRVFLGMFRALMNGCDHVVMANQRRRDLIQELVGPRLKTPIAVVENYPDRAFANLPEYELPPEVRDWLGDDGYVLAQGGAHTTRHWYELVEAALRVDGLKLVAIGHYQEEEVDALRQRHGGRLAERVLLTGFVPQMEIVPYIDQAVASAVFYGKANTNSRLCASNRLYQAICRGVPVVVSESPPMRDVVEGHGCGVVVDAASPTSIEQGLERVIHANGAYRARVSSCSRAFMWEDQQGEMERILCGQGGRGRA
jgi:glycosyltransferase involved in cell wall biosynthesis